MKPRLLVESLKISIGVYSCPAAFTGIGLPSETTNLVLCAMELQPDLENFSSQHWVNQLELAQDDCTTKSLTISLPLGNRFYRLHKP